MACQHIMINLILYVCCISISSSMKYEKLLFSSAVWRHGDRSTLHPFDNDSDDLWPRGLGQLTNKGIKQEYELGRFLRSEYNNKIIGLSSAYRATEIYIRSTCVDRAIMSGEASMDGFYRPTKWEKWNGNNTMWIPVPVHSVEAKTDFLLQPYNNCPNQQITLGKIMATDTYINFEKEHKDFYQFIKDKMGQKDYDYELTNISQIYDNLICKKSNNKTLPVWATDDVVDKLTKLVGIAQGILFTGGFNYEYWDEITPRIAGPFFQQVIDNFENNIHRKTPLVMAGYSAHDTTIAFILSGMKAYNWMPPPYGSCIMFELHSIRGSLVVKVRYRNDTSRPPYDIKFMNCPIDCPYAKFKTLAKTVISKNRDKICGVTTPSISPKSDYLLRYRVAVVVMIVLLITSWFILGWTVQKNKSQKKTQH